MVQYGTVCILNNTVQIVKYSTQYCSTLQFRKVQYYAVYYNKYNLIAFSAVCIGCILYNKGLTVWASCSLFTVSQDMEEIYCIPKYYSTVRYSDSDFQEGYNSKTNIPLE